MEISAKITIKIHEDILKNRNITQYGEECFLRRHSSPYCCWSLWWISADGTFSPTRNLITMRCSTLRGTVCSLTALATPRQDWKGSNPSRREGGGCGFTLSRSHSCCCCCCSLFTHKSVPVIFEPPCTYQTAHIIWNGLSSGTNACVGAYLCIKPVTVSPHKYYRYVASKMFEQSSELSSW